jgi:hypothetical protein
MSRLSTAFLLAGVIAACVLNGRLAWACSTAGAFSVSDTLNAFGGEPVFDTSGGPDNGTLLLYSVRVDPRLRVASRNFPAAAAAAVHMQASLRSGWLAAAALVCETGSALVIQGFVIEGFVVHMSWPAGLLLCWHNTQAAAQLQDPGSSCVTLNHTVAIDCLMASPLHVCMSACTRTPVYQRHQMPVDERNPVPHYICVRTLHHQCYLCPAVRSMQHYSRQECGDSSPLHARLRTHASLTVSAHLLPAALLACLPACLCLFPPFGDTK